MIHVSQSDCVLAYPHIIATDFFILMSYMVIMKTSTDKLTIFALPVARTTENSLLSKRNRKKIGNILRTPRARS